MSKGDGTACLILSRWVGVGGFQATCTWGHHESGAEIFNLQIQTPHFYHFTKGKLIHTDSEWTNLLAITPPLFTLS